MLHREIICFIETKYYTETWTYFGKMLKIYLYKYVEEFERNLKKFTVFDPKLHFLHCTFLNKVLYISCTSCVMAQNKYEILNQTVTILNKNARIRNQTNT